MDEKDRLKQLKKELEQLNNIDFLETTDEQENRIFEICYEMRDLKVSLNKKRYKKITSHGSR